MQFAAALTDLGLLRDNCDFIIGASSNATIWEEKNEKKISSRKKRYIQAFPS